MVDKKRGIFLVLGIGIIAIILLSFLVVGSVKKGNPFFEISQTSFGPGQTIEGILNFSLIDQSANSFVSGSVSDSENEMRILEFLNEADVNYNCEPDDCSIVYEATTPSLQKSIVFEGDKYFGLKINGFSNVQIKNLSFSLDGSSTSGMTCGESPIQLDLIDDGVVDWEYKETSGSWCTANNYKSECFGYGLYNNVISSEPFCQQIKMNKTGDAKLFANLKVVSGEDAQIEISIYDDNVKKGGCTFTPWSNSYRTYECSIDTYEYPDFYISENKEYFVCIRQFSGIGQVTIKSETNDPICGFKGVPPKDDFTNDYDLSVQLAGFAPFNEPADFDKDSFIDHGKDLEDYLQDYIDDKYNGDCSGLGGCVIPIKFTSTTEQELTINNLYFRFDTSIGEIIDENFYDVITEWPIINMDEQAIPFSILNINAPEKTGSYIVSAKVGTKTSSQSFKVESVPTIESLSPKIVIPGRNTEFTVVATAPSGRQIVEYTWDFGDNTGEITTTEPETTHAYSDIDTFLLTIKAKDNLGLIGSKTFSITSNITKGVLNDSIYDLKSRLESFESNLAGNIDYWYEDMLGINVTDLSISLEELEAELETASQSELIDIKTQLDMLDIPISIEDTLILMDSPYFTNLEEIEPVLITEVTKEIYNSDMKTQYQNAIVVWQEENFDLGIGGQIKSLFYDDRIEDVLTIVNIKIDYLGDSDEAHVIFHLPYGLSYDDLRVVSNSDDISDLGTAICFSYSDIGGFETINIALPGRYEFSEIMYYISPSLSQLNMDGGVIVEKKSPYGLIIFLIITLIIIIAILLWLIWKGKWKGRGPRKKVFKNPMDVYNIISFISSNQAAGIPKKQIIKRLLKVGWNKKQIAYAFKKMKEKPTIGIGRPGRPGYGNRPTRRPTRPVRPMRRPPPYKYRR